MRTQLHRLDAGRQRLSLDGRGQARHPPSAVSGVIVLTPPVGPTPSKACRAGRPSQPEREIYIETIQGTQQD
ncbi:hypothetical protein [Frankia sp. Cr2]|uniref:hypothetical protein n=1 Tax=Frankia sp. Cr2 TaxID=3073932 RepID=UPI002AD25BDB|nr:hypothetical protein [Frankia sp. Cr2]